MIVSEIFLSIQGESTYAGLPCIFVRLAGCNLSCTWCDTDYARETDKGFELSIDEVFKETRKFKTRLIELTGGEPLLQPDAKSLAHRLIDEGYTVLIETNGSIDLKGLDDRIVKVVDVKCPSSGHGGSFLMDNLDSITGKDEVKFVIGDIGDYEYAKRFMDENIKDLTTNVLFAPVTPSLPPATLAEWILKDGIRVRLQPRLHHYIWEEDEKGR
ncbi:MAG: radical SAM protein [Deltaproteobacteria bacterium]|nr:radical SAM protein [Deltaproteobacteria bacterium]